MFIKRVLSLALMLTFAFAAAASADPIEDFVWWEVTGTRELENFMVLHTEEAADHNVLCNAYSGLLEVDNKGRLKPAIAKEWGTDDGGLIWTFKLRDDVVWVDVNGNEKAKCDARDWLTAIEWVLNFHKNGANNTSMLVDTLAGAQEYYDLTKDMEPDKAFKMTVADMIKVVGIEAPDNYTLVYHCKKNAPYFDTLATRACLYPFSQALIDEMGIENVNGMNNEQIWYNGAYTITEYINNNRKELKANPKYWDKDANLFKSVTIYMISDLNTDDQLYETGEVDQCDVSESNLRIIWNDKNHPYHDKLVEKRPRKYSYQIHFNFAKNNPDKTIDVNWNTAIANENFRKSIYYGLNLMSYWSHANFIYPMHCENLAYTMKGLLYFSDGTDYVDRVIEKLGIPENDGTSPRRLDAAKAAEYAAKAREELEAKGVTFPVRLDYYIKAGAQTPLDQATLLKDAFEAIAGKEYIDFNICTYVSSINQEVARPRLQALDISGWGADYGDPENFIGQEIYGSDKAYYGMNYSNINSVDPEKEPELIAAYKEFTALADKASEIYKDMDARYQAYVDAEVCMLNHAFVVPIRYEVAWQLTKVNDYSKMEAMFGSQNYTYKNWETNDAGYSTADYEKIRADFNASK